MRTLRTSIALWAGLALCGCAGVPASNPNGGSSTGSATSDPAAAAADVIRLTNDARARNGLAPLASNAKLMQAARIHAQQMAKFQRLDHTINGAQYPTMQSRLEAVAYPYSNAAENVAWNQRDPASVVNGWMNSSGHRANILNPDLREIGAAMARTAKGEPYWIQVFGTPR